MIKDQLVQDSHKQIRLHKFHNSYNTMNKSLTSSIEKCNTSQYLEELSYVQHADSHLFLATVNHFVVESKTVSI